MIVLSDRCSDYNYSKLIIVYKNSEVLSKSEKEINKSNNLIYRSSLNARGLIFLSDDEFQLFQER
jgi:hypothetical protein